jgi:Fic family protein
VAGRNALTMADVADCLEGTAYQISGEQRSVARTTRLIDRARRIEERYAGICDTMGPVVGAVTIEQRAYQTHHSMRLELQGPRDLQTTQELVASLPTNVELLAHQLAQDAIRGDEHLLQIVGAYGAELLAERMAESFTGNRPFTEADLRELNRFVVHDKYFAGSYRTDDFLNLGQHFDDGDPLWFSRAPDRQVEVAWMDVPVEMDALARYISRPSPCPPLSASVAHAWFTRVHPFRDGNGRVARLIATLVLLRNRWPPVVIRHTDREDYLDSLEESDAGGDIQPFFELMIKWIDLNLDEYTHPDIFGRSYAAELTQQPSARLKAWTRGAWQMVHMLREALIPHEVYVERVTMPASSTFTLLELGESRAATLLAKVHPKSGLDVRIGLGFMSHEMREGAVVAGEPTGLDGEHAAPTIYFQERNPSPNADFPFVHRNESEVSPSEVCFPYTDPSLCLVRIGRTTVLRMPVDEATERLARSLLVVSRRGSPS